jgi:serine/threonine protein phosphatase PrpC
MDSASFSVPGPKGSNQDSFLPPFSAEEFTVAAVADGVGGQADGRLASSTVIEAIHDFLRREPAAPLESAFASARESLARVCEKYPLARNMATTLSLVRWKGSRFEVGHVGDTRVYHIRDSGLISRTKDQTEIAELVRQNVFTPEEARRYPRKNILLSSLSADRPFEFYNTWFETEPGDIVVLCSDGLYNSVRKSELIQMASLWRDASEFAVNVRTALNENGVRDDATFIVIRV